jgi:hypothetical protein
MAVQMKAEAGPAIPGRLALTLFVKPDDPASNFAREEVQALLTTLVEEVTVEVLDVTSAAAAAKDVASVPMLRIQIGSRAPEWTVQVERRSLARRLADLGVWLHLQRPN